MLSFVIASILFISICIVSLIISYYMIVLLNENKTSPEPALNGIISTNVMLLFNYITDLFADTLEIIIGKVTDFVNYVKDKPWMIARILTAVAFVIALQADTPGFLKVLDKFFRCVLQPLVQNVLFVILHIVRIIVDLFLPAYNYYLMVYGQVFKGSLTLGVKCDAKAVYESLKVFVQIFIAQFESITDWSGVSEGMSVENNIFVNEWNVTQVFMKSQEVIYKQKVLVNCACDGLSDIAELFFVSVNTPHPPRVVNHIFNAFLSSIQMFIQISPPFSKELSMNKVVFHLNSAIFETGQYFDTILIRWAEIIIGFFDKNFQIQGAPKNFIGTSIARFGIGFVHLFHTMIRSIVGIIVPIKHLYQDSDYMVQLTSIDITIMQWRLGVEHLTSCLYWFAKIIESFISDTVINNSGRAAKQTAPTIPTLPPYVDLDCYTKPFLNEQARTVSCIAQMLPLIPINIIHVFYSLFWELVWKSLIFQEQSVLRTFQRYDGLSYPKTTPITCEVRKQAKKDGWDLTNKECLCVKEYDFKEIYDQRYPFGIKTYDPYCGQPNLQADVFGLAERLIKYSGNFVGIKYVFAFVENFYLAYTELIKIAIKVLMNFYDIGRGKYFQYPINCGYGVSELALEEWWLSEGKPFNSEHCKNGNIGVNNIGENFNAYIGIEIYNDKNSHKYVDQVFKNDLTGDGHFEKNQYTQTFKVDITSDDGITRRASLVCYPKHEFLRYYRCIKTKYNGEAVCTENKNGCTCNTLINISSQSHCQCIYNYPDTAQEVSQQSFKNPFYFSFLNLLHFVYILMQK